MTLNLVLVSIEATSPPSLASSIPPSILLSYYGKYWRELGQELAPAELHLSHLLSLTSVTALWMQLFQPFVTTLQGLHPEQTSCFAHKTVSDSTQIQVMCSFCFILQCTTCSPDMGLIWHEYHNRDINNKTWIWHEHHNQVMPIFNHLIFQLPAKFPQVCNRMPVSSVWGSSFLHPLKAGTVFSFLRHPHTLMCSWVLHRLLQLVPWVP